MMTIVQEAERLRSFGYDVIPVGAVDPSGEFNPKNPGIVADWQNQQWSAIGLHDALNADTRRGIGIRLRWDRCIDIESDTEEADAWADMYFGDAHTPTWRGAGAGGHFAGKHRLFQLREDHHNWLVENQREGGFKTKVKLDGLGAGVEVRCTGQSVVPPSGNREWLTDPKSLIQFLTDDQWSTLTFGLERKEREAAEAQADTPGADFCIRGDWREILEPHGWTFLNEKHVCRPGKTGAVSATIAYCTSDVRGDLLYIFSDDPEIGPLENRVSYSKFEAFAILNHEGSFSDAARELRRNGYGFGNSAESMFDEIEWEDPTLDIVEADETAETGVQTTPPEVFEQFAQLDDKFYNNVIGEYVQEVRTHSNIDYQSVYYQALEIFGAMVGRNGWYRYNLGIRYLTDYLIVAGKTGAGKGSTFDAAKALFKPEATDDAFADIPDHEKAYNAINRGRFGSAEGLLDTLSVRKPDYDVDGFILGQQYWGVLFLSDQEASAAFAKMFIDNSVINETYRQAWDFNTLSNKTKTKDLLAKNPVIGFVWHIVPDDLSRLPAGLLHGGFINRLKIVHCAKPAKTPRIQPGVDLAGFKTRLGSILTKISGDCNEITFNSKATARLDEIAEWQHNLEGIVSTTHERYTAHVERMACRLALLDGGRHIVRSTDVDAAEAMQRVVYDHTERLIGGLRGGDEKELFARSLLEYIQDAGKPVSKTEINRFVCNNRTNLFAIRDASLDRLVGQKLIARGHVKGKRGRPGEFFVSK